MASGADCGTVVGVVDTEIVDTRDLDNTYTQSLKPYLNILL